MNLILAMYDFSKIPSPALCEATQRALDAIDPRMLLCVERNFKGAHVEVRGPLTDWHVASIFYDFIETMRATDTMQEWERRQLQRQLQRQVRA